MISLITTRGTVRPNAAARRRDADPAVAGGRDDERGEGAIDRVDIRLKPTLVLTLHGPATTFPSTFHG
jgi:hypothetical protein